MTCPLLSVAVTRAPCIGVARIRRKEAHLGDVEADLRISIAKIGPLRINPTDQSLMRLKSTTKDGRCGLRYPRGPHPTTTFPHRCGQSQRAFFVAA